MIRRVAVILACLAAGLAGRASEIFPVAHNERIILRIMDGRDGKPLPHAHVTLAGGYEERDLRNGLWREEALTDEQGRARLSEQLANLPWLRVWVARSKPCQAHPDRAIYSVERIRRDGLSGPNHCGEATGEDAPGVLTVFVRTKAKAAAPAGTAKQSAAYPR